MTLMHQRACALLLLIYVYDDAKLIFVREHEPNQGKRSLFSTLFSQNQFVIFFDVAIVS